MILSPAIPRPERSSKQTGERGQENNGRIHDPTVCNNATTTELIDLLLHCYSVHACVFFSVDVMLDRATVNKLGGRVVSVDCGCASEVAFRYASHAWWQEPALQPSMAARDKEHEPKARMSVSSPSSEKQAGQGKGRPASVRPAWWRAEL